MSKYLNRLAARLARETLRESAKEGKNWIVSKKLILETDEGDFEFEKNDEVEIGGNNEGDMVLNGGQAACVIVADEDLARKIADIVVSSDELSDVQFVDKPALDAVVDGEEVDDVIDKLADDDDENVETAEVSVDAKESVEAKFAKFAKHIMNPVKTVVCESILVDEEDEAPLNLALIKHAKTIKESFTAYDAFTARVSELKGSLQPGKREIALTESGKVMGAFDKEASCGTLYCESEFDDVDAMDNFDDSDVNVMEEVNFNEDNHDKQIKKDDKYVQDYMVGKPAIEDGNAGDEPGLGMDPIVYLEQEKAAGTSPEVVAADLYDLTKDEFFNRMHNDVNSNDELSFNDEPITFEEMEMHLKEPAFAAESCSVRESVENVLRKYEESTKTGADYMRMTKLLVARGLKESTVAKIVSTFDNKSLKECVRAYDSKYGKYVACFKESADCDNFIVETKDEKRFTKRFFN